MSTSTLSVTFTLSPDMAEAVVVAMDNEEFYSLLDEHYTANQSTFIGTYSRNSDLESSISEMIGELKIFGLEYLVETLNNMHELGKWYTRCLSGLALLRAIDGLRKLLEDIRRDQTTPSAFLDAKVIFELDNPPATLEDAVARHNQCLKNGGEGIYLIISFLQAQLGLLEYARDNTLSAVYGLSNN